jgi:hypothetical protein
MCRADSKRAVTLIGVLLAAPLTVSSPKADQQVDPPSELRATILQACHRGVLQEAADLGRDQGFGAAAEVVLVEDEAVFLQEKKDRIKVEGRGEFRYGPDYLMGPMTFSCEWDATKNRVRKSVFQVVKGTDPAVLPPHKAVAVEACRRDVRKEFEQEARSRQYFSPTITLFPGVRFEEAARGVHLYGELEYELDPVQQETLRREWRCDWDPESGRTSFVQTRGKESWKHEVGRITCESRNMARKTCRGPIGGNLRVQSNKSDTRCSQGVNWSWSSDEIVVWDGCRAVFEFDMR